MVDLVLGYVAMLVVVSIVFLVVPLILYVSFYLVPWSELTGETLELCIAAKWVFATICSLD